MIEILDGFEEHVVAFRVAGRIDENDIDTVITQFQTSLDQHARVTMYAEAEDFEGFTLRGFMRDLRYGLSMIGKIAQVARAAVVTDSKFVSKIAEWEGKLFRDLDIKGFALADRDTASRWVNEAPGDLPRALTPMTPPGLPGETPYGVVAFSVDGTITSSDIRALSQAMEECDSVRLLVHFENFEGVRPGVLSVGTLEMKLSALGKVVKYAIVNPPAYVRGLLGTADSLTSFEIMSFGELDDAWRWVLA